MRAGPRGRCWRAAWRYYPLRRGRRRQQPPPCLACVGRGTHVYVSHAIGHHDATTVERVFTAQDSLAELLLSPSCLVTLFPAKMPVTCCAGRTCLHIGLARFVDDIFRISWELSCIIMLGIIDIGEPRHPCRNPVFEFLGKKILQTSRHFIRLPMTTRTSLLLARRGAVAVCRRHRKPRSSYSLPFPSLVHCCSTRPFRD